MPALGLLTLQLLYTDVQGSALPLDTRALVRDLPFEGKTLLSDQTDEIIE